MQEYEAFTWAGDNQMLSNIGTDTAIGNPALAELAPMRPVTDYQADLRADQGSTYDGDNNFIGAWALTQTDDRAKQAMTWGLIIIAFIVIWRLFLKK